MCYCMHVEIADIVPFYCLNSLGTINVMDGVSRRFPQVQLMPSETEDDLISAVRTFRNEIRTSMPEINLETIRIDSCINGYGMMYCI